MRHVKFMLLGGAVAFVMVGTVALRQASPAAQAQPAAAGFDATINQNAQRLLEEGRRIFRYDTFGSDLKERFNRDWWDEEQGSIVLALDPEKRQVRAVTSNVGHWKHHPHPSHSPWRPLPIRPARSSSTSRPDNTTCESRRRVTLRCNRT